MKARLPKGYGGGPQDRNTMLKQMQKMQEMVQQKQEELDGRLDTAGAGGGAVSVTVKGGKEVTEVLLKPEVVDPDDVEMLQDLILAATNEALRTAQETSEAELGQLTGGLGLPGM
jgi:DNA-binding YbaB/EbfC family protein